MQPRAFDEPSPGFRLVVLDSLIVVSLSGLPDPVGLARLSAVAQKLHASCGRRIPILYSVDMSTVQPPDASSRQLFEKFAREAEGWCASTYVVLLRPGFVGAIIRAIVTGLRLAVGARAPMEFHPDLAAAHRQLIARGESAVSLAQLTRAVESMQSG